MVKSIDYDNYGRPVFNKILDKRPTESGEQFTLVYYTNDKPVKSYDIAVIERGATKRPLEVIYEWTGAGYKVGVAAGKQIVDSVMSSPNGSPWSRGRPGTEAFTAITPVIVFTTGGFVVGLIASVPSAIQELKNIAFDTRETLISFTAYEYDEKGRLNRMRMFLPGEGASEVVRTDFFYLNGDTIPYKTEIRSYPEDKVRTIQ